MIDNERSSLTATAFRLSISSFYLYASANCFLPSLSKHANNRSSGLPRSAKSWIPNDNQASAGVCNRQLLWPPRCRYRQARERHGAHSTCSRRSTCCRYFILETSVFKAVSS